MDYQKIYNDLCCRGQTDRNLDEYCEMHHIIPKCMGGTDETDNLTKLTFKEHYLAHYLLTKIYAGSHPKIHYAFLCMLRNPHNKRVITARMYSTIKTNFSEFKRWHIKQVNPGKSEKSRNAARQRMLSDQNPAKKNPEKNHKAKPIIVTYFDGSVENYSYAKLLHLTKGIPYDTIKWALLNKKGIKKYNIVSIEQINK